MEFAFELALCAHLEATADAVVARQLGAAVAAPGSRVVDVCLVEPGPNFGERTRITDATVPPLAVESAVGVGEWVRPRDAFESYGEYTTAVVDDAVAAGFFERRHRGGSEQIRQAVRYPEGWFDRLVAVENKPDLGTPGDLERQLQTDASLGLFDEVVLATESYVTRAHLNRIPEAVGVWRFRPDSGGSGAGGDGADTGDLEVVREPTPLDPTALGVEATARRSLRTDVAFVSGAEKARKRRRIAERSYGKGWRTYDLPPCAAAAPTADGRPRCAHYGRVVDPASDCGADCPGFDAADPPAVDLDALRATRSPWVRDPGGVARRQSGLDRFL
ncbi:DUF5787 family protein [Halobium salinum]|uniref:DUF5787 family protein n=1 Tax=Halobium salinum TaxID=1364940 RepID=A0ABD5PB00_9EURY|nr:DUF5787 family protein [Halobium salinum]